MSRKRANPKSEAVEQSTAKALNDLSLFALERRRPDLLQVADFVEAVEQGEPTDPAFLSLLADSLRELLRDRDTDANLRAFVNKLGIKRRVGKGNHEQAPKEEGRLEWLVVEMIVCERKLIEAGYSRRTARAQGINEVAKRERVSRRTAQDWRRRHGESAECVLHYIDLVPATIELVREDGISPAIVEYARGVRQRSRKRNPD